ncbi:CrfX protein [Pseudomonas sp. SCB32]|uniref:CrfX protein n=1 Tax=Pseudomonas sp. SCB32 TaxID=2653853 RepID=UPI0015B6C47D|nr:CrfX protein [Pseudomonas sp. SCB32]
MHMHDPFEESLRDLLKMPPEQPGDDLRLGRVLKTANRQVGAGDLFSLMGHWLEALSIGVTRGALHLAPVSRRAQNSAPSADKAD